MAEHLTRFAPVLYVDPPISHLTIMRHPELAGALEQPRLRILGPRLARLTPMAPPGKGRPGIRALSDVLRVRAIRRAVHALDGSVAAMVVSSLDPVFHAFPECCHALYGTDDYVAGARLMGVAERRLASAERRQLRRSDVIVAISPLLAERWRARGHDVAMIPNGCDVDTLASWHGPVPADVRLHRPIAGFVGHLNARIDLGLLEAVAGRGLSLLLVGPRERGFEPARLDELLTRPNVLWLGPKPFRELPAYLAPMDVGLVPYADSPFNQASFPLKTLDYLAAGKPVVATDLAAMHWLGTHHVTVTAGAPAFATAAVELAGRPASPQDAAARQAFAAGHSWKVRAEDFARLLGLLT